MRRRSICRRRSAWSPCERWAMPLRMRPRSPPRRVAGGRWRGGGRGGGGGGGGGGGPWVPVGLPAGGGGGGRGKAPRRPFYAGMAALAGALLVHAPPEKLIAFDWPDAVFVDGGLVGGG